MKNFIKKITAVTMAIALIGAGSAISEIIPDYNSDYAVVHAADKKTVKKNEEKKQTQKITYVIDQVTKQAAGYVKVERELRNAIPTNSSNNQHCYIANICIPS